MSLKGRRSSLCRWVFVVIACVASVADAQVAVRRRADTAAYSTAFALTNLRVTRAPIGPGGAGQFALEALGGSLGSLAGMGVTALATRCDVEDLGCLLGAVGVGGLLGVVGATVGTTLVARQTTSQRSVAGAALGAVVGTGAGLGVHYLLNRGTDRNLDDAAVVLPIFAIAQGTFSALGSRLLGSRRR